MIPYIGWLFSFSLLLLLTLSSLNQTLSVVILTKSTGICCKHELYSINKYIFLKFKTLISSLSY